jgi:[ribosomal protein S5]-alanine N-acetyltransferase
MSREGMGANYDEFSPTVGFHMVTTEKLIIRPFHAEDAEAFFELTQDDGFNAFPITIYRQKSSQAAGEWIKENARHGKLGKYAVIEKTSKSLIGMGGLTPWEWEGEKLVDITYRIRQSHWGRGLGRELAHALMKYAVEDLQLSNITATITPDNSASINIATELGLKFDQEIILLGVRTDLYRQK